MKHGQVVYKRGYWTYDRYRTFLEISFRYRFDPVPGVRKFCSTYFKSYYKTPKSTNERRQWFASEGYGRARRSCVNLPNAWDDYPRADRYYDTCWKKNRKVRRQWQKSLWR